MWAFVADRSHVETAATFEMHGLHRRMVPDLMGQETSNGKDLGKAAGMSDQRLTILLSFAVAFILVIGVIALIAMIALGKVEEITSAGLKELLHTLEILASVWIGAMAQGLWRDRKPDP